MQEDPFAGLLHMMREQGAKYNPPSMCIGRVITSEPLHIKIYDQDLYDDDVLIADYLLADYKREASVNISGQLAATTQATSGGSGYDAFASHTHSISGNATCIGEGELTFKDYFKKDDLLAVMPLIEEQQYIILARVVRL